MPTTLPKLRKKRRTRVAGRKRQYAKYKATGKQGHLKQFRVHKRAVAKLTRIIKRVVLRQSMPSPNFSYSEFNCRQGDPVPEYMHPHLDDLCKRILEPMRAKFGSCYVTSGHRWSWYDAAIGGVGGYHVYEKYKSQPAADCIFQRGTPSEWAAYARSLGIGGVGEYPSSGFVHVDTGPRRDWWG